MSYGQKSFTEKLKHSTILDLLQIGVYAYFGYISYTNLDYTSGDILSISTDPTVIAVQLAGILIAINSIFLMYDRVASSKGIR